MTEHAQWACPNCAETLGGDSPILPHGIHDDDGSGAGALQHWCPQCFVWIRAKEDRRYDATMQLGMLRALACGHCGKTSVSVRGAICGQCNSPNVVELGPKAPGQHAPLEQIARAVGLDPYMIRAAKKDSAS